ncbi:MAG: alpha/beta hydrolase, partial [Hyphomicrobiales bacterium]|nr:alpha/beta hydrolase [Hyphomicrobiales bacterium]
FGLDSINAMARRVLETAPGDFVMAGFSMGGRVALEVMRIAPERVTGLAIFDTGVHPRSPGEEVKRQAVIDLAHTQGMEALAAKWLPPMLLPATVANEKLFAELTAMVLRATPEIHEKQILALLHRPDAEPVLRTIRCPTIVLCGRQDQWSPPEQHEPIAAAIPGAKLVIAENCGHFLPVEAPQVLNAALRELLEAA